MSPSLLIIRELAHYFERAAVQVTNIFNTVLHHCESGQTQTKREAGVLLGVDTALFEHLGMDHAAGAQLQPTAVIAGRAAGLAAADQTGNIQFKAGFYEREEARTQTYLDVSMVFMK